MPRSVKLTDPPKLLRGRSLPEYPKFIIRTERVVYGRLGKWKALWRCQCGNEFEAFVDNVGRRHTTSCGCEQDRARSQSYPTHGHFIGDKPSLTYKSWQAMIARCTNPKHPAYKKYAGQGVTICARWRNSFPNFLADMGERPAGKTLDRKDPFGNYEPSNCRWADHMTQTHNTRRAMIRLLERSNTRSQTG